MICCLFEDKRVRHFLPLVATCAVYDMRVGMRTLLEATCEAFDARTILHARPRVAAVTAEEHDLLMNRIPEGVDVLFVNGRYVAHQGEVLDRLRAAAQPGQPGRVFVQGEDIVAAWVPEAPGDLVKGEFVTPAAFEGITEERVEGARMIRSLPDLITDIRPSLEHDFRLRAKGYNIYERPGADIHESALLIEGERIIVAPGATIRPGAILNASEGPIFIGKNATVWEGAVVRGPLYLGEHGQIRALANVEGCSIGAGAKVGGEIHTTVVHSYSNKVHSGFLGHSYIGRWCNLGADTNNSNLKNNYGEVSFYNEATGDFESSREQFLGLFMGDHTKCGINTMFNTGTVVGVSCNIFGGGFVPRHVPSFSWGGPEKGFTTYRLDKALKVAEAVMRRRDHELTEAGREMLSAIAEERMEKQPVAS